METTELKCLNECTRSGAGTEEPIEPTLWYYDEFQFLISQQAPTASENTIEIVEQRDKENEEELGEGSSSFNTTCSEAEPRKKKSKRNDDAQELITLARKRLERPQTEFKKISAAWTTELANMASQQQLFAKKAINDIFFEGQMGTLHRESIIINMFTRTPTPYSVASMESSPIVPIHYNCELQQVSVPIEQPSTKNKSKPEVVGIVPRFWRVRPSPVLAIPEDLIPVKIRKFASAISQKPVEIKCIH